MAALTVGLLQFDERAEPLRVEVPVALQYRSVVFLHVAIGGDIFGNLALSTAAEIHNAGQRMILDVE